MRRISIRCPDKRPLRFKQQRMMAAHPLIRCLSVDTMSREYRTALIAAAVTGKMDVASTNEQRING